MHLIKLSKRADPEWKLMSVRGDVRPREAFPVPAFLVQTGQEGTLFFGRFYDHETGAAFRTGLIHRFVPGGEITGGKTVASEKNFAASGGLFNHFAVTALNRTVDAGWPAGSVGIQ